MGRLRFIQPEGPEEAVEYTQDFRTKKEKEEELAGPGDRRDGKFYVYTDEIVLAVEVALATGRPLLLFGPSGSGKSSLAFSAARVLKRRYYEIVVTSRTQARDMQYSFDAIRRLAETRAMDVTQAQQGAALPTGQAERLPYYPFIEPRALWWIIDRESAERRGEPGAGKARWPATDPARWDPAEDPAAGEAPERSVLLIDEIDKADPDVPNNLLVALGSQEFQVEEIQQPVRKEHREEVEYDVLDLPLVIITSNRERQLPVAFMRRCVQLEIKGPEEESLLEMAKVRFGDDAGLYKRVYDAVADQSAKRAPAYRDVSIAEYIDTVRACKALGQASGGEEQLKKIVERTVWREVERQR